MRLLKVLFVTAAAAAGLIMAAQATAAKPVPPPEYDVKSYPGSECNQILFEGVENAFFWGCNQDSTLGIVVSCSIVRDDVMGEDGTYDLVVDIWQGVGGPSSCQAISSVGNEAIEYVSDSNLDYGLTTLYLDLDESAPNGYYQLLCGLAPGSCIYSYRPGNRDADFVGQALGFWFGERSAGNVYLSRQSNFMGYAEKVG